MQTPEIGMVFDKSSWFTQTGYSPHPGQRTIHFDNHRHRILCNGRRWGKTLLGGKESETWAFVKNFLGQPQIGWFVGPEYSDAEKEFRVIYNTFKSLGIDTISSKFLNNTDNGNMHIKTKWGFDLQCRSAHHPETLVGEGLDFVLLVEAGRLRRRMFGDYIRPALSDKRGQSIMSGVPEDATESSLLYWAYQRGQDKTKTQWKSWKMPSWTNTVVFPGGRQDPEILEAEDDLTEDEFARQYGGEFVERYGRVMSEWDSDIHVANIPYHFDWPLYAAVDFGFTNDWTWLWIQLDPHQRVRIIGEHRFNFRDTDDIARNELRDHPLMGKCLAIYPDPASPDDSRMLRRILQVPVMGNTGGELKYRLGAIRRSLKSRPDYLALDDPDRQPGLMVDKSCHKFIWEMSEGYRWPEKRSDTRNQPEAPLDKDNHGPEALGRFMKGHMSRIDDSMRTARQSRIRTQKRRVA